MNKIFLNFLLTATCCLGCKSQSKNDSIPLGTIKADINGVTSFFTTNPKVGIPPSNIHGLLIYADDTTTIKNTIAISILSLQHDIKVGAYYESFDKSNIFTTSIQFFKDKNHIYATGVPPNAAKVEITYIDSTSIKGKFSGSLVGTQSPKGKKQILNITNGSFNVSLLDKIQLE